MMVADGDGGDGGCDDERVGHLGRCKSKHSCATTVTVQLKSTLKSCLNLNKMLLMMMIS